MNAMLSVPATELEHAMRVRIHVTPGQRRALLAVLDRSPEPGVRVADFTASFDLPDATRWLEARMAEWPRGEFPRASLHGVTRKLSAAIRGQVQPDPATAHTPEPMGQAQPDPRAAVLRRAAALIRSGEELRAGNAVLAATTQLAILAEGMPMRVFRAVADHLSLTPESSPLTAFTWWDQDNGRTDVADALDATAAALDDEAAGS